MPPLSTAPSLTTLPVELRARILDHLRDEKLAHLRSFLRCGLSYDIFHGYLEPDITERHAEHEHVPFSKALLAPALASPALAAAVHHLIDLSYLTDLNTEGQLVRWVHASGSYVQAISTGHIVEASCASLSDKAMTLMLHTLCSDTLQLFKAITINHVKLHVLDLVRVPFHKFHEMYDSIISGLCAALESTHTTLEKLALPVYPQSDLCARALEMVELPHLNSLSVELKNEPHWESLCEREEMRLGLPFLRMMQAVDGHANRTRKLTTLKKLSFMNMHCAPCTDISKSGCSPAFFRAVEYLAVAVNPSRGYQTFHDLSFFLLFTKLEILCWNMKPLYLCKPFQKLCRRLIDLHLCERRWMTCVQVGAKTFERCLESEYGNMSFSISQSFHKMETFMTRYILHVSDMRQLAFDCPSLRYLSLYITSGNVHELRRLIKKCSLLTGLEIIIDGGAMGWLEKDGWHALGKAIPRSHAYLSQVAIQTKRFMGPAVPVDIATDCFVNAVKRIGWQVERLLFRALVKTSTLVQMTNSLCRIVDACMDSWNLMYLEVDIRPRKSQITPEGIKTLSDSDALTRLRKSKDELLQRCVYLGKIDFGLLQSERII